MKTVRDLALNRDGAATLRKAAIAAGTTADPTWAEPLVNRTGGREFRALIDRKAAYTRAGFLRGPFNVPFPVQTGRATGYKVLQSEYKPVTQVPTATVTIETATIGTTSVLSNELLRFATPGAEAAIARQLSSAVISAANVALLDPNTAGSITNGITPLPSTGLSDEALFTDLVELLRIGDKVALITSLPWAVRVLAALGNAASLLNVIVAPEAGDHIIAVDPTAVAAAWTDDVEIDEGKHATLQMRDDPATGAQELVSMFQTDSSAVRVEVLANWQRVRDEGVAVLDMGMSS